MLRNVYVSFIFLFSFLFVASQNASLNLIEVSNLPYNSTLNDIWGYVDGQGVEYALVGAVDGVSIVSLSDPANPNELFFLPGVSSTWRDLKTFGNYAYVSNESADGIRIIDLSGLPATIDYKDTVMQGINTVHNLWIDRGILFALGPDQFNGGAAMFDLKADPWRPVFLGAYSNRYIHDLYGRSDTVYAAEINDGLLTILDISDPANPVELGSRSYQNSFTHNTWLNDAGNVCFTTDELAEAYLYAWDVSDPGNIQQLDRIRSSLSDGNAIPHNTHVLNDYLVTSYYRDGINIVDAARPHNLIEVGYYDTSPALENGGFNGSWGAYPFLPSGLVLASDMENGLFVLQPNYVRGCYLEGNITDAMTSAPLSSVDIIINGPDVEETSMTNGSYAMGLAQAGSYTVTYSKLGYIPENRTVQLQNGVLVIEDVELQPLVRVDAMIEVVESNSLLPIGDAQVLLFDPNNDNLLEDYVTDANGQALGSEIFAVTYDVIVARWGYQTQKLQVAVDPSNPQILLQMDPGYYDDFVVDFDWFVVNDASTGIWERGEPNGTFAFNQTFNPDNDLPTDIGNRAFVTGNASGVGIGEDDVDDGFTSVQSPIMDLRDYKDPILTFHWWLVNLDVNTGGSGDDYLQVDLISLSGIHQIARYDNSLNNFWTLSDSIHLNTFTTLDSMMYIRFLTIDAGNPNIVEAAIDQFVITEGDTTTTVNTALDQQLAPEAFLVYPNPSNGQFLVDFDLPVEKGYWSLSVQNLYGVEIESRSLHSYSGQEEFALNVASGLYLLVLRQDGQVRASRKIRLE